MKKQKRRNRKLKAKSAKRKACVVKQTTAIVKVEPPPPPVSLVRAFTGVSMVPKVKQTVEDFERVRRFVTSCLNIDMQRWEAKNPYPDKGTRDDQKDWEEKRIRLQVDWGTIPGNPKPFLMQPGAEKFLFWLELRPEYVNHESELGDGHLELISRVLFFHKRTKEKVFDGPDCSCTTMETNYRYVWAEKDDPCPLTFRDGHDKRNCAGCQHKAELKAVKMGRSRKVGDWSRGKKVGERWIWEERVDNPNIYNERNKVRQMAGKRGLVKGVRNMGAISEIFTADPSEWDLASEEPDESPEAEMDYTENGRKIYVDGVSPSGRHKDPKRRVDPERQETIDSMKAKGLWCERHQCHVRKCPSDEHTPAEHAAFEEAEKKAFQKSAAPSSGQDSPSAGVDTVQTGAAETVPGATWKRETERKADMPPKEASAVPKAATPPPMQFRGTVEINFIDCPECPIVRGDLQDITEVLKGRFQTFKWRNNWYHISPGEVPSLVEALAKNGFKTDVIMPKTSKSSAGPPRNPTAPGKPADAKRSSGAVGERQTVLWLTPELNSAAAAPAFVSGTIERVNSGMAGKSPIKRVTLVQAGGKKYSADCFHKSFWDDLEKGLGKLATFKVVVNGNWNNIEALVRIGSQEYDDDGKKVMQRDREAGSKTLFT